MKKIIIILGLFNFIYSMESITNRELNSIVTFKQSERGLLQVTQNILKEINNPAIVVWYSGEDGLTKRSKDFYEKNLITPLKQGNTSLCNRKPFQLYLYDLNAWNILKGQDQSKLSMSLESIITDCFCGYCNIQSLSSKGFFQWLSTLNKEQINVTCNILKHSFIWKKSDEYCKNKIILNQDPLYKKTLSDVIDIKDYPDEFKQYFAAKDNAYVYSALQYLEAFFITQKLSQSEGRNIVFLLPGDEYTYYVDTTKKSCTALQEDLNDFLKISLLNTSQQLQLYFYSFKYSHNGCTRPYLKINSDDLYLNQQTK